MRLAVAAVFCFAAASGAESSYEASVQEWRASREAQLRAPDGWLSVAGLWWLKPGINTVGSSPGSDIQLPGTAPAQVGSFRRTGNQVRFEAGSASGVLINGKASTNAVLRPDPHPTPDIVQISGLKLFVLNRGERIGIRMKDNNSVYRRNFRGLKWFPVRNEWLIDAKWVPYTAARKRRVHLLTGDWEEVTVPGYAEFKHQGQTVRLTPSLEGERLFFVFRDRTAGKLTYPAARFLYADAPKNGRVTLDFNKAYTPPCAFTPYATCPLPTRENRLTFRIPAGELNYEAGH